MRVIREYSESDVIDSGRRRWYCFKPQFSLRSLMVVVVLVSLASSWFAVRMHQAREQRQIVEAIQNDGGTVYYDDQCHPSGYVLDTKDWPEPFVVERTLGRDFARRVVRVAFDWRTVFDDDLVDRLRRLGTVRALDIGDARISDSALDQLDDISSVTDLWIDTGARPVKDLQSVFSLPRLRSLYVSGRSLEPGAISQLGAAKNLRLLSLDLGWVTEQDMRALQAGKQLEVLLLWGDQFLNEDNLRHLIPMTNLETLSLGPCCDHDGSRLAGEILASKLPETQVRLDIGRVTEFSWDP